MARLVKSLPSKHGDLSSTSGIMQQHLSPHIWEAKKSRSLVLTGQPSLIEEFQTCETPEGHPRVTSDLHIHEWTHAGEMGRGCERKGDHKSSLGVEATSEDGAVVG